MTVDVTTGDGNVVEQDTHSGFDVAKYNDDGRLMWRPRCSRTGGNPYNAGAILSLAEQKFRR